MEKKNITRQINGVPGLNLCGCHGDEEMQVFEDVEEATIFVIFNLDLT